MVAAGYGIRVEPVEVNLTGLVYIGASIFGNSLLTYARANGAQRACQLFFYVREIVRARR